MTKTAESFLPAARAAGVALLALLLGTACVAGGDDLDGLDAIDPADDGPVADFGPGVEVPEVKPEIVATCEWVTSTQQDFAAVQTTGSGMPAGVSDLSWVRPTKWTSIAPMQGTPGQPAAHEGDDYIHNGASVATVDVVAATGGTIAYVRKGCPQKTVFKHNNSLRECGSGWGNHVVVHHGGQLYTRYAHLAPLDLVKVGEPVSTGQKLGDMGNSGRSELRHLHFELGTRTSGFDPCAMSQSFTRVYKGTALPFGANVSPDFGRIECPPGYAISNVGSGGGKLCVGSGNAWGPFTAAMEAKCRSWGGGDACASNRWTESLARAAYGNASCPVGATKDGATGYCVEGAEAFGPFPAKMVTECKTRGGGDVACGSARWGAAWMRWIYKLVNP